MAACKLWVPLEKREAVSIHREHLNSLQKSTASDAAITNMKASLLFFRLFTYNPYNSLILQILKPANNNPSCSSSIRIFKVLFTDKKSLALIAAYLNHWVSRQKWKNNYFTAFAAPYIWHLWKTKKHTAQNLRFSSLCQTISSLSSWRINARNLHFKDCFYGSSMQWNVYVLVACY